MATAPTAPGSSDSGSIADAELARRAAAGDRDAFAAIYERYRMAVYRFARLMSGSAATAEDVTQEVFVTLIRTLATYQPQRAGLLTYLYGVARNVTRNRLRRERRFIALEAAADTPSSDINPHEAAARAEERAALRRVMLTLPSRFREVVILSDVQGLAYGEIARILAVPVGTVRSRLSRGRRMIADCLKTTESSSVETPMPGIERCAV
jgi:RNA polymerase sigma-70 factor (ECF subfamily)